MDVKDYRDIFNIYKESTFKKQLIFQGFFLSLVILSFPISYLLIDIYQMKYYLLGLLTSLFFIIWISIVAILEKKEIFIPLRYYRYLRYRVCYFLIFFVITVKVNGFENALSVILILSLIYIPIEIYSGYKEYRMFKIKMDQTLTS